MRTDATINRRAKIKLPNISASSILGFDRWEATNGDIIIWTDPAQGPIGRVGRVIGKVDAPALGDTPEIEGWICIVQMMQTPTDSIGEFWVNPNWVTRCIDGKQVDQARQRMDWFLMSQEEWKSIDTEVLRTVFDKAPWFKPT